MLDITKTQNGGALTLALSGRLDTTTAPQLEAEVQALAAVTDLTLDMEKLEYVSSAGLRVLLAAQKIMSKQGKMQLTHVCDEIREVLDITGFSDILTIL